MIEFYMHNLKRHSHRYEERKNPTYGVTKTHMVFILNEVVLRFELLYL